MKGANDLPDDNPLSHFGPAMPENEMANFARYAQIVANYTRRNLAFKTGIMRAFSGITAVLEMKMATSFRYGLPERALYHALFWIPSSKVVRRQLEPDLYGVATKHIPSWSWAAWEGLIHYIQNLYSLIRPGEYEFHPELRWVGGEPNSNEQPLRKSKLEVEIFRR